MTGQTFTTRPRLGQPAGPAGPAVGERVRRAFPTPGVRAWGAAGMLLAAAAAISQAFEAVTR